MEMQPYNRDEPPTAKGTISMRTYTLMVMFIAALIVLGMGLGLGYLGASVLVVIYGAILSYNIMPIYTDEDTNPNPLIRFTMLLTVPILIYFLVISQHKISPKDLVDELKGIWWLIIFYGLSIGADDWDPKTGKKKHRMVRMPGTAQRKRNSQRLLDAHGGDIGDTDRLPPLGEEPERGARVRRRKKD